MKTFLTAHGEAWLEVETTEETRQELAQLGIKLPSGAVTQKYLFMRCRICWVHDATECVTSGDEVVLCCSSCSGVLFDALEESDLSLQEIADRLAKASIK